MQEASSEVSISRVRKQDQQLDNAGARARTRTGSCLLCIGSLSLCDSNSRTECKRFRDHNVQTVRLRVWRWSTHLEIFSSVLRGKKPGKGLGFPGTIAHSRFSTKSWYLSWASCPRIAVAL